MTQRAKICITTSKSIKRSRICLCEKNQQLRNNSQRVSSANKLNISDVKAHSPIRTPAAQTNKSSKMIRCDRVTINKANASSTTSLGFNTNESRKFNNSSKVYTPIVLVPSKDKEKREEYDLKYPWPVDEVRDEYVASLKKSLKCTVNPNLYEAMFTTKNFKYHIECVNAIKSSLIREYDEMLTILDLLLKWAALRLLDNNPGFLKCIIEFLSELTQALIVGSYMLTVPECTIIMQILTDKLSSTNSFIRDLSKQIISLCQKLSTPNLMSIQLIRVLRLKNSKAKLECIDILKGMVMQLQTVSFVLDKDLNFIATLILTKDNMLKASIIDILGEAFNADGELCWRKIGIVDEAITKEIKAKVKVAERARKNSEETIEAPQDEAPLPTRLKSGDDYSLTHYQTVQNIQSFDDNSYIESMSLNYAKRNQGSTLKTDQYAEVLQESMCTVQSVVKQLKFNNNADLSSLTKNMVGVISKESNQINLESIVYHFANHAMLGAMKDITLMSTFIFEVLMKIQHCFNSDTTIKLFTYLQLALFQGHATTMVLAVFRIAQSATSSNAMLISKCLDIFYKKIKEIELEMVFKEFAKIISTEPSIFATLCQQFIRECVRVYGIDIWNYIKETECNSELQAWIDAFVFDEIPEFANIIKGIKTTGVKGLAGKLKEFSLLHPGFNFEKAFSRCSSILMQQIKDELANPKEKDAGTPSTLKDSIEKLREKYNKASPATQMTIQTSSVESRLKELSEEITKLKVAGGL